MSARERVLIAFVGVFAFGAALGVVVDRRWLAPRPPVSHDIARSSVSTGRPATGPAGFFYNWGCNGFDGERIACGGAVAPFSWCALSPHGSIVNANSYEYRLAA